MASLANKLSSVQEVDIDESGKFKYILIKVFAGSDSKFIVRGYDWAEFHGDQLGLVAPILRNMAATGTESLLSKIDLRNREVADIYDQVSSGLNALGLKSECVGGGRIQHNPNSKEISVYGYSMGFGRADHQITVNLLKKRYPGYKGITFSNDGY